MQLLKADTLTKVVIGPVVAVGDGFTPVASLAVSSADEAELMKHDAAAVTDISGNTFAAITSADGYYNLTLTAAQLDTEGRLTVLINDDSLCLPVRHDFMVVNANVYDSLYAAATTDYLQTDVIQVGGSTEDIATETKQDIIDSNVDSILTDTGTTIPATISTAQADLDILTGSDGVTLATSQPNYAPNTTTPPTTSAIAGAVWDEASSGHNTGGTYGKALRQIVEGTVSIESTVNDASATTTSFITALTETTDDHFIDVSIVFIDGALVGQSRPISSYNGTTKTITLDEALTEAPGDGDGFIIKTDHVHPVSQIADAVLDEALSGHVTAGSLGKAVSDIETDAAAILVDTADMQPKLGTPSSDVSADIAAVKAETALIVADTNELQTDDVPGLIAALNDITVADILTTAMTESYSTDGSAPTITQALMAIQQMLQEASTSGTTLTVKKVDGSTTAMTFTLNDATTPTSITRAT